MWEMENTPFSRKGPIAWRGRLVLSPRSKSRISCQVTFKSFASQFFHLVKGDLDHETSWGCEDSISYWKALTWKTVHGTLKGCALLFVLQLVSLFWLLLLPSCHAGLTGVCGWNMFVYYCPSSSNNVGLRNCSLKALLHIAASVLLLMSSLPLKFPLLLTHLQPIQVPTSPSTRCVSGPSKSGFPPSEFLAHWQLTQSTVIQHFLGYHWSSWLCMSCLLLKIKHYGRPCLACTAWCSAQHSTELVNRKCAE